MSNVLTADKTLIDLNTPVYYDGPVFGSVEHFRASRDFLRQTAGVRRAFEQSAAREFREQLAIVTRRLSGLGRLTESTVLLPKSRDRMTAQMLAGNFRRIVILGSQMGANKIEQGLGGKTFLNVGDLLIWSEWRAVVSPSQSIAVDYVQDNAAKLAKGINDATRARVRAIIRAGAELGYGPDKVARLITQHMAELPRYRARRIALTESTAAWNHGQHTVYEANAHLLRGRYWIATFHNTRDSHRIAHNRYHRRPAPMGKPFIVNGYTCNYPGDLALPVGERVNCQCDESPAVIRG